MDWNIEKYKNDSEPTRHWELKRDFMQSIKHMFDEDRVVCLAQVLGNIEFMGCQYPHDVMIQVRELSKDVVAKHRERAGGSSIQRTLVSGSLAANNKVNRTNSAVKRGADQEETTSRPAKHAKYANFVAASSSDDGVGSSKTSSEGFILPPARETRGNSDVSKQSISNFLQSVRKDTEEKEESEGSSYQEDEPSQEKEENEQQFSNFSRSMARRRQIPDHVNIQRMLPFNHSFPAYNFILVTAEYNSVEPSFCILQRSASFCNKRMEFNYLSKYQRFEVRVENYSLCQEYGKNESEARQVACDRAVEILSEYCYNIVLKSKFVSDGTEVDIIDVEDNTKVGGRSDAVGGSNIGHKLLSMMGWEGGGLGKHGSGIAEPITAESVFGRQGMGFKESARDVGKAFNMKIEKIIKEYIGTPGYHDLVFTTGFDNPQRAVMHKIARKYGLKSKSFGKGDDRHLTISKKLEPISLLEELVRRGGETEKFQLKPPGNLVNKFNHIFGFD